MTSFWKIIGYKKISSNVLLILALCCVLLFFHTRGIYYADDGYILSAAQRIYDGQIPYRDFHFVYTPLTLYIDALAFKLFGVSILATRILAFCNSLIAVYIIAMIVKMLTPKKYFSYIAILFFLAWGPTHSNFIFPTQVAITMALLTCYLFLLGMQKKKNYWLYLLSSFTTFLIFLGKQNFGIAFLPVALCFFIFSSNKYKLQQSLIYLSGLLVSSLVFIGTLFFSHALSGFFGDFYSFSIQNVLKENALSTVFFYEHSLYGIMKSVLYLLPLFLSVSAGILCLQKNKKLLFLPVFTLVFYITGIRPTTDYIHLTPILSLNFLSLILILTTSKTSKLRSAIFSFFIVLIAIGFYTALWKNYYRWNNPLIDDTFFESNPRIEIFAPDHYLSQLTQAIDSQTKPGDYIFITYYSPMLYFTSDRKNPTRFDLFEGFPFYNQYKKEIMEDVDRKKTTLIITPDDPPSGFLAGYIKAHYRKVSYVRGYLWKRQ